MEGQYNLKSTAVKRLMQEAKELNEPTEQYFAQPLEDNLFEWHFTVRGPAESEFADGLYHGRIILPPEYPMKPPSIILLTPNGRFETNKKICLSISGHHPESWQPSWSIRTALLAIIGFMPTHGSGAIGALDYTKDERRSLALRSQNWHCTICKVANKTLLLEPTEEGKATIQEAKDLAAQISFKGEVDKHAILQTPPLTQPAFPSVLAQTFPNFNSAFVTPLFNTNTSQNEDIVATDTNSISSEVLSNNTPVMAPASSSSGQSINLPTTATISHEIHQRHTRNANLNESETRPVVVPVHQNFVKSNIFLIIMMFFSLAFVALFLRRLLHSVNLWNIL